MLDFISIVTENTSNGKESKIVLLPLEKSPANLVDYIKKKYRLNDKKFEEVLKNNDADIINPKGGELEIRNHLVCWVAEKAVRKSDSGKYILIRYYDSISESDNGHNSLLYPFEEMPQILFTHIKEVTGISEYEMYYEFFKGYGFLGKHRYPKEGHLELDGKDFYWDEATEFDVLSSK